VAEIWAYHSIGDQLRFTLVQKTGPGLPKGSPEPRAPKAAAPGNGAGRIVEKPVAPKPVAAAAKPVAKKPVKAAAPAPPPKKVAAKKVAVAAPAKTPVATKKAAKPANGPVKKKAAPPAKSAKRR
jgi:hypothetical protein